MTTVPHGAVRPAGTGRPAVPPQQPSAGPSAGPSTDPPPSPEQVETALRALPSHGWTAGWIGRRDRALLVLSQVAGLSYQQIAQLAAGDVEITDGTATITTLSKTATLTMCDDDLVCGPCALARWLHVLNLSVVYPDTRVMASMIARAAPITARSPHMCLGIAPIAEATRGVALLPPIDRWGHLAPTVAPLSARVRTDDVLRGSVAARVSAHRPTGQGDPRDRGASVRMPRQRGHAHDDLDRARPSRQTELVRFLQDTDRRAHDMEATMQHLLVVGAPGPP